MLQAEQQYLTLLQELLLLVRFGLSPTRVKLLFITIPSGLKSEHSL
jgi:hypothetical protein